MQTIKLYIKDWLAIHPYIQQQATDRYFVDLANRLYSTCTIREIPESIKKKLCLYTAAYFEDVISGLGLWQAFIKKHLELYDTSLPFYTIRPDYIKDEINEEDIRFIIWNTLEKAPYKHPYINPMDRNIEETSHSFFRILDEEYETAPANDTLQDFFMDFKGKENANHKLRWLFGHTYLTEPSVQEYIAQVTETDKFIIPCGPLALFLHEWIDLLTNGETECWEEIEGLYPAIPEISDEMKERNHHTYQLFTQGTNGARIVYLEGYKELHRFLTQVLQWPDDSNHTLPQMKEHKDFIMMVNSEKGILLAKDICKYISDPLNPMYDAATAAQEAFSLLTIPTKCPPDLMEYVINNHYIPDAQFPEFGERELVQKNADFIARTSLLYYYRGDSTLPTATSFTKDLLSAKSFTFCRVV